MENKEPEDYPVDHLATRLQEAMSQGRIQPNSPGYNVARVLIEGLWKDLSEADRAVFHKHVLPMIGE